MKKYHITCDACGKEINEDRSMVFLRLRGQDWENEADLCLSCAEKIRTIVKMS